MILDTEKVMAEALLKMDDAYTFLRVLVADESVLNESCPDMLTRRTKLTNAIKAVFETRNAVYEISRRTKGCALDTARGMSDSVTCPAPPAAAVPLNLDPGSAQPCVPWAPLVPPPSPPVDGYTGVGYSAKRQSHVP